MGKGQRGISGSDRGFMQIEKEIRELKRSREYQARKTIPITLEDQLRHLEETSKFSYRYPSYSRWQDDVLKPLKRHRVGVAELRSWGISQEEMQREGYDKAVEPEAYAKIISTRLKL